MQRIYIEDAGAHAGETILIKGWIDVRRDQGKMVFLDLRDVTGKVQAVVLPNHTEALDVAQKLRNDDVGAMQLRQVFDQAFADAPSLGDDVRADLSAIFERDPAVNTYVEPFLFF